MAKVLGPFERDDGPRLRRILEALVPLGELAGLFQDVCVIVANEELFAAAPNLVLHGLRELFSALRDVLDPGTPPLAARGRAFSRPDLRGELADLLLRHGFSDEEDVLDRVEEELGPRTTEEEEIRRICGGLGLGSDVSSKWESLNLHGRAHRRRLRVTPVDSAYRTVVEDALEVLEAIADAWSSQWPRFAALIEEAAAAPTPSRDLARRLGKSLPTNPPVQEALLTRLGGVWVPTLRKAGLLPDPPLAIRSGRQAYSVSWPAGSFLARVASDAPREVAEAIQSMRPTDNPLALEDIASAVAAMPLEQAKSVLPLLAASLNATDLPLRGDGVVWVIARHPLSDLTVMAVAEAALRPRPVWSFRTTSIIPEPQHARLAALVASGPDPAVAAQLLAGLLVDPTDEMRPPTTGAWVPDLTAAAPVGADPRAAVATALLTACQRIDDVGEALGVLQRVPVPLGARLRLELLRRRLVAAGSPELGAMAAAELAAAGELGVPAVDREWAMLAGTAATWMADADRRVVLAAIGIDPEAEPNVHPSIPEGADELHAAWRSRRWLVRVVAALPLLPPAWQHAVEAVVPPGLDPTAVGRTEVSVRQAPSPVDKAACELPFGDLVATVATRLRELAADPSTPLPELGRTMTFGGVADYAEGARAVLAANAAADPAATTAALSSLLTLPERAAVGAVDGLSLVVRQGQQVDWGLVAAFACQVLDAGPSDEWDAVLYGGDVVAAARDHAELVRGLADLLQSGVGRVGGQLAAASPERKAIVTAFERMLKVSDPAETRTGVWEPRPDVPPRSIATVATGSLMRLLPSDQEEAVPALQSLLDAAHNTPAVRCVLGYQLYDLAGRYPAWTAEHVGDHPWPFAGRFG